MNRKSITILSLLVVLTIILAVVTHFFVLPILEKDETKIRSQNNSVITVLNNQMMPYSGKEKVDNINEKQQSLGNTTPPAVIFGLENNTAKNKIDIYIDLYSQKNTDFILFNRNNFTTLLQSGEYNIHLHFLPTTNAFGTYVAEAVCEIAATHPDKAWNMFIEMVILSVNLDTDSSKHILDMITKTAKENGITEVDQDSLKNGTFFSWLMSIKNDVNLNTGFYPPLVYINEKLIDTKDININNADELRRVFVEKRK